MLNSMVSTMIPASSEGTRRYRWISAVAAPTRKPNRTAADRLRTGSKPATVIVATIAAPKGKAPSEVRSGSPSMRKGIITASAGKAKIAPWTRLTVNRLR